MFGSKEIELYNNIQNEKDYEQKIKYVSLIKSDELLEKLVNENSLSYTFAFPQAFYCKKIHKSVNFCFKVYRSLSLYRTGLEIQEDGLLLSPV